MKPVVVLSKCLEFAPCRYNGVMIPDRFVKQLAPHVTFLPVCPEVEIGLGIPRDPIRLVSDDGKLHLLQPATGKDLSEKMERFSNRFLASLNEVDGFILKNRSPSCGIKNVKRFPKIAAEVPAGKGAGFFAGEVLGRFPDLAIEDEGRLNYPKIRDHFLTKLFTLARFREAKKVNRLAALVRFHATHQLLLMAYNQKLMRLLGKIVVNSEKRPAAALFKEYEPSLQQALARPPRIRFQHQRPDARVRLFFRRALQKREGFLSPNPGELPERASSTERGVEHFESLGRPVPKRVSRRSNLL